MGTRGGCACDASSRSSGRWAACGARRTCVNRAGRGAWRGVGNRVPSVLPLSYHRISTSVRTRACCASAGRLSRQTTSRWARTWKAGAELRGRPGALPARTSQTRELRAADGASAVGWTPADVPRVGMGGAVPGKAEVTASRVFVNMRQMETGKPQSQQARQRRSSGAARCIGLSELRSPGKAGISGRGVWLDARGRGLGLRSSNDRARTVIVLVEPRNLSRPRIDRAAENFAHLLAWVTLWTLSQLEL